MTIAFDNSYARLPDHFFARQTPQSVSAPSVIAVNNDLARQLDITPAFLRSPDGVAMLAGNLFPDGAEPLAQAYAGHQFGGWVPQLGDGRAVLVGEVLDTNGRRFDLQLKGAGQTPFSRRGDGRNWIGPVLREYIVSEAMAAFGLPTTRALGAVETGDMVMRDMRPRKGAVLARVAASHIRVGTFQYFAARNDIDALKTLTNHVIERHYPQAESPLDLLHCVVRAQAELIAGWMSVGFIHGVMNTDNMAVSGETIDYGPCAFMDSYHPSTVFSSIDQYGRYAYGAQPQIAAWNLAQFATCLLPLMGERDPAIEAATQAVNGFIGLYQAAWLTRFGAKIGLSDTDENDLDLIQDLLQIMADNQSDFTITFSTLRRDPDALSQVIDAPEGTVSRWLERWRARVGDVAQAQAVMAKANPVRIPRNHRIEAAIAQAEAGDYAPFHLLQAALAEPYTDAAEWGAYEAAPTLDERVIRTFCGT
ncbi:YdiU family protein [Rhodobacteraceae bacterium]|nr:YdiU family protein [Paracoccaceae bacterium]